jgi:hypothetical protein
MAGSGRREQDEKQTLGGKSGTEARDVAGIVNGTEASSRKDTTEGTQRNSQRSLDRSGERQVVSVEGRVSDSAFTYRLLWDTTLFAEYARTVGIVPELPALIRKQPDNKR